MDGFVQEQCGTGHGDNDGQAPEQGHRGNTGLAVRHSQGQLTPQGERQGIQQQHAEHPPDLQQQKVLWAEKHDGEESKHKS